MNLSMKEAVKRGLRPGVMLTTFVDFWNIDWNRNRKW